MYHEHKTCRICQCADELCEVADFGATPLVNDFCKVGQERAGYAPLKLLLCTRCQLPQLSVVVDPHILYDHYPYIHSESKSLRRQFDILTSLLHSHRSALGHVMEFGSNDGLFLEHLKALPGVESVFGIDPCERLVLASQQRGVTSQCGLFGDSIAATLNMKFDTVIGRHVFAHIDDWRGTIRALDIVTHKESIIAIEVQYAGDLLAHNEWDMIYHEHLSYVTVHSLIALLRSTPFYLHDVAHVEWMGGSIIAILRRKDSGLDRCESVESMLRSEPTGVPLWKEFKTRSDESIAALRDSVFEMVKAGEYVLGYGAPAKSTNWIHQCGFNVREIFSVLDTTPAKQGRLIPGTNIPVISRDFIPQLRIDKFILFLWNFEKEILEKEAEYRSHGGKFIIPLPTLHIV